MATPTMTSKMTPNMCVAWNLRRARMHHRWTQEEAVERLAPQLGRRWTKGAYSAAERSVTGDRIRQFSADDLFAFSRAFRFPVTFFLCPPPWAEEIYHGDSEETVSAGDWLDQIFDVGESARQWLLSEVVPMTAQTTRALRRWGSHFADMVSHRERELAALAAAVGEREDES